MKGLLSQAGRKGSPQWVRRLASHSPALGTFHSGCRCGFSDGLISRHIMGRITRCGGIYTFWSLQVINSEGWFASYFALSLIIFYASYGPTLLDLIQHKTFI